MTSNEEADYYSLGESPHAFPLFVQQTMYVMTEVRVAEGGIEANPHNINPANQKYEPASNRPHPDLPEILNGKEHLVEPNHALPKEAAYARQEINRAHVESLEAARVRRAMVKNADSDRQRERLARAYVHAGKANLALESLYPKEHVVPGTWPGVDFNMPPKPEGWED